MRFLRPIIYLLCALFVGLGGSLAAFARPTRPNVIVVLSDDQGYGDFSCHGNPVLKTPNLDRLHDESIRLTDFHVAPMCTPTRGQLLSGLDALHSGASSVCAGRSFIRRGIPIMPEAFRAAGYRTGHFGKWHLGDSYPHLPHQRGFEESVYFLGWGITSMADTWQNDCFDGRFHHNGRLQQYPGYCTDVWFDLAMNWMRERGAADEPFLCYLPTNAVHGPHWVADGYKLPYQQMKGVPAAFFGMMANLDENMGRLDAFLHESKLHDNTIVIYLHDNGGTAGVKLFNAGMRGRKTQYYEGGHRAACFVRWPQGELGPPRDIDQLTEVQDLLPTLADWCDVKLTAAVDGTSLAGLLADNSQTSNDKLAERMLVVQYGQRPAKWDAAVLWKKWRLIFGTELYDLTTDPEQEHNVIVQHSDVAEAMVKHYEAWWAKVEPKLDDFSPISIGAAEENPVTLTAADWANVYCDNMQDLRSGKAANGPWHLLVEEDGQYEFALRRWPKEADAPIAAGVPAFVAVDGGLPPGKALPIARARIKLGDDFDQSKMVANDQEVVFSKSLHKGARLPLQTWFYDADDHELCGAYFVEVVRK